jgi:hypothetical protein
MRENNKKYKNIIDEWCECCDIDDIDVTDKHIYNSNIDVSFEAFDCMVQDKKNTHAFKAYL